MFDTAGIDLKAHKAVKVKTKGRNTTKTSTNWKQEGKGLKLLTNLYLCNYSLALEP